jgi:hypothetical protein
MPERWFFDELDIIDSCFHKELAMEPAYPAICVMFGLKCEEIAKNPQRPKQYIIDGVRVYVVKTGAVRTTRGIVPRLLIGYILYPAQHRIVPLHVCKSPDGVPSDLLASDWTAEPQQGLSDGLPDVLPPTMLSAIRKALRLRRSAKSPQENN